MKSLKRLLCISLSTAMALSLVACGNKGKDGGKIEEAKKESINYVFEEDYDFDASSIEGEINDIWVSDGNAYVASSAYDNEEGLLGDGASVSDATADEASSLDASRDGAPLNGNGTVRLYKVSLENGQADVIDETSGNTDELEQIASLTGGVGSDIYCVKQNYMGSKPKVVLYKVTDSGLEEVKDISDVCMREDISVSGIVAGKDGIFGLRFDEEMVIVDENFNEIGSFKQNGNIINAGLDSEGNILASVNIYDEKTTESTTTIYKYNKDANNMSESYVLDSTSIGYGSKLTPGTDGYDFYYSSDSAVYGFKYSDKTSTKILDYSASDINTRDSNYNIMIDKDHMVNVYTDYNDYTNTAVKKYVKVDPETIANRTVLTLASVWGNASIKQCAIDFNKSQNDVRIQVIDYSEAGDPAAKFSADIAAGNIPDLYDLSTGMGNMSVQQAVAKGMFEDLTPYLEKDGEISKDDLIPSIYDSMLTDGKLYSVSSSVFVRTLSGKASEIGKEPGWTFSEMKEYAETKPDDAQFFYSNNKDDILTTFLAGCGNDFIDWNKGECSFDSQEFKDVLVMCNRGQDEEMDWGELESTASMISSGKLLFVQGDISPAECRIEKAYFNGDIVYKGYPNKNKQGNMFSLADSVAMSAQCEDKDSAWKFLRTFFTEEFQGKNYSNAMSIPTREDVFQAYVEQYKCTEAYTDKYGNEIKPQSGEFDYDGVNVKLDPFTQEEMDEFRNLVDSAHGIMDFDSNIKDIISEEAKSYFSGDKTVDEVTGIIQNRVTTYINENK